MENIVRIHKECGKPFENECRCYLPKLTDFMHETIEFLLSLEKEMINGEPVSIIHQIDEIYLVAHNGNIFAGNVPGPDFLSDNGGKSIKSVAWQRIIEQLNCPLRYDNGYSWMFETDMMFGGWITFKGTNKFLRRSMDGGTTEKWVLTTR